MTRRKRTSDILEKAEQRAASLKSIATTLDLGNDLTLSAYTSLIDDMRSKLATYNTILSEVDNACTDVADTEKVLRDLSEQMLMGVVTKFGKNSHEYGMAGGVRKVDRKRPKRSVNKTAVPLIPAG
jgi:uncharacterized protein YoxC